MRESALLQHIYATARAAEPAEAGSAAGRVTIPPGDDMGGLRIGDAEVLVAVDQLADQVHADLRTMPLEKVGRKALLRNLSDVAAMAAQPCGAVAAATLPRGFGESRATALFDAIHQIGQAYDCPVIGGDIASWPQPLLLSITVLAEPAGLAPVLRRGAQPGDTLYVTGQLGGSLETVADHTQHLDFTPRIDLARALATDPTTRPHAMIDLSDGIGRDLPHLCQAGGVSAEVDAQRLPISIAAEQAASRSNQPSWWHAIADGEDYELLFAAPEAAIPAQLTGVAITPIGRFIDPGDTDPTATLKRPDGTCLPLNQQGWEHHG
jgi:thiamine-monophosphate kinase